MKYFTPELFVRLQECPDADAFAAINASWEQSAKQYWAELQRLAPGLPPDLRLFVRWGSMHDARVLGIGTTQRRATIILKEDRAPRLVTLVYALVEAPVIDQSALPAEHQSLPTAWLYDEVERDPEMLFNVRLRIQDRAERLSTTATAEDGWRPIYLHSILLSNGWEVRLRFHRLAATRTTRLLEASEAVCQVEGSLSPPSQVGASSSPR
jgi:hypothetical protein